MTTSLVLSLCLLAGDLQYRENVAENPSFEEDRDRDTHPDSWRPYAFDSPARLDWDDSVSRNGKRSLRISDSFRAGDQRDWKRCTGRWVSARRPIEPENYYETMRSHGNNSRCQTATSNPRGLGFILARAADGYDRTLSHFVVCQLLIVPLSPHSIQCQWTGSS